MHQRWFGCSYCCRYFRTCKCGNDAEHIYTLHGRETESGCGERLRVGMTSKEKYALLDKLNLCHRCEKARPAPGRKFCFDCLEKIAAYNAKHYDAKKAKEYQSRRKELYQQKKEHGICVRCSKPATHGIYCYECSIRAKKHNQNTAEQRRRERHERGLIPTQRRVQRLCLRCGAPATTGAYCQYCMSAMINELDKSREKSPFRQMERKRLDEKFRRQMP